MEKQTLKILLLSLSLVPYSLTTVQADPSFDSDVSWYLHTNSIDIFKPRLAMVSIDKGWFGLFNTSQSSRVLYQLTNDKWHIQPNCPLNTYRAQVLDAISSNSLWVCSFAPKDEETYDGLRINHYDGEKWTHTIVSPGIWPQTMDMLSDNEGWIGGNHGLLLHFRDGNWTRTRINLPEDQLHGTHIFSIQITDSTSGWLVGSKGLVACYENETWNPIGIPDSLKMYTFFDMDLTDDGKLWFVGEKGLIVCMDIGTHTFQVIMNSINGRLNGIDMVSNKDGWVVGNFGSILRYNGTTWDKVLSPTQNWLMDIKMFSPTEGWIVGSDIILRATKRQFQLFNDMSMHINQFMNNQSASKIAAIDFDEDLDFDLFFQLPDYSFRMFKNDGKGYFTDITDLYFDKPSNWEKESQPYDIFSFGDVDNDGDFDAFLRDNQSNNLNINQNKKRFLNYTKKLNFKELNSNSDVPYFIDIDRDGDLDLYVSRLFESMEIFAGDYLYLNNGYGEFTIADSAYGMKGAERIILWGDLNGDLYVDAIFPNPGKELIVYLNDGHGNLKDVTAGAGLDNIKSNREIFQGCLFDADIDGDLDFLVLGDALSLFLNDGSAHFTQNDTLFQKVNSNSMIMSTLFNVGDINNDGYLDFIIQPSRNGRREIMLFISRENGHYENIAPKIGLDKFKGESAIFSDLDNDGDLDLYITRINEEHNIYLQNQQNNSDYLKIRPHGILSNRKAIGAKILIFDAGHLNDFTHLRGHQQVGAGLNPRAVCNLDILHFGLGSENLYDVQVFFPGGKTVVRKNIRTGQIIDVYEYPFGIRQIFLFYKAAVRSFHYANLNLEIPKLVILIIVLIWIRLYSTKRIGPTTLISRRATLLFLLLAYCFANGILLQNGPDTSLTGTFTAIMSLLFGGLLVDKRLTHWRTSLYIGHYRLQKKLGEGGMGQVFRARNIITKRTVALKIIHPRIMDSEYHKKRFLREAKLLEKLKHPNIVKVYETGEIGSKNYISMELLTGNTLSAIIKHYGKLQPNLLVALILPVCDALSFIHQEGVIHRDVKSENIFVIVPGRKNEFNLDSIVDKNRKHETWKAHIKLMDLGLARCSDMHTITLAEAIIGTLAYMSPQQAKGHQIDERSDIYSLGVVMYEALTGRLPFSGEHEFSLMQSILECKPEPIHQIMPEIPVDLGWIIMKMMSRSPRERFQSIEELQHALEQVKLATNFPSDDIPELHNEAPAKNSAEVFDKKQAPDESGNNIKPPVLSQSSEDFMPDDTVTSQILRLLPDSSDIVRNMIIRQTLQWRDCYKKAKKFRQEGKHIEAHLLMIDCSNTIQKILNQLTEMERISYLTENNAEQILKFMDTLNQ